MSRAVTRTVLTVTGLEDRTTPSAGLTDELFALAATGGDQPARRGDDVVDVALRQFLDQQEGQGGGPRVVVAPQPNGVAIIDFAKLPLNPKAGYKLQVTLVAADGTTREGTFDIAAGTSPEAVRDLVQAYFVNNGWTVEKSPGTGILVHGYGIPGLKGFSPVKEVGAAAVDLPAANQPSISTSSGVTKVK